MAGTKRTQREESTARDLDNGNEDSVEEADSYLRRIRSTFRSNLVECLFHKTNGLHGSIHTLSASSDDSTSTYEEKVQVRRAGRVVEYSKIRIRNIVQRHIES